MRFCLTLHRLKRLSHSANLNGRKIRAFYNLDSFTDLPTLTGDEVAALFTWMPLILHDGDGVMSMAHAKVCVRAFTVHSPSMRLAVLSVTYKM